MNRRAFLQMASVSALAQIGGQAKAQLVDETRSAPGADSKFLILSCDGGGMRGYLSALIMQQLNKDTEIFGQDNSGINLYAGTSTGGLIALGLAAGNPIDSVVSLYENDGANIFSPIATQSTCIQSLPRFLQGDKRLASLYQTQFDDITSPSVRDVVEAFIPNNPIMRDLPNNVMVTTLQMAAKLATGTSWNPLVIDNFDGSQGASTKVYDAALSTSAAPVYFPPYEHPQFGWCSDGGLFANNPAPQALAKAIQSGVPFSSIAVLSIGTGIANASMPVDGSERLCYGASKWTALTANGPTPKLPLFNAVMDGVATTNDYLCEQLLGGKNYLRINPVLTSSVSMDDYSPATMQMFRSVADTLFNSNEWEAVKTWVRGSFTKESRF